MVKGNQNQEALNGNKTLGSPFAHASSKQSLPKEFMGDGKTSDNLAANISDGGNVHPNGEQGFQLPSGEIKQPLFPSGAIRQPQSPSGEIKQPLFPSGAIRQPQFPSGEIKQPLFPSGAIRQPQFPSGEIKQPLFPSGVIRQPQFPSGEIKQPLFPSGVIRQPQFPSGEIKQPQNMKNGFAGRNGDNNAQDAGQASESTSMFTSDLGNSDIHATIEQERDIGGDYRIGEQLGRGGCAVVYEAWRHSDNQHVAIKVLQIPAMLDQSEAVLVKRRFNREAQLIASLNEEHIVKCVDYGSLDGTPCMVLEFVSGEPLDGYLTNYGALPVGYALGIVRQLLLALEASHRQGIIHRDIKPSNIMMFDMPPPYEIRVLDFGISTVMEGFEQDGLLLTQQGSIRGTPAYMAPELFTGETRASVESDLYAVGLVLLEALTAEVAFYGETFVQTAYKHVNSPLLVSDFIEPSLAAIILKCCEKDPQNRYHSAHDVIVDLDACKARAIAYEEKYEKHGGKNVLAPKKVSKPLVIATASLFVVVLLIGALWMFGPNEESNAIANTVMPSIRPLATPIHFIVLTPSSKDIGVATEIVYNAWRRSLELLPAAGPNVPPEVAPVRTITAPKRRPPNTSSPKPKTDPQTPGRVRDNTAIPNFLM